MKPLRPFAGLHPGTQMGQMLFPVIWSLQRRAAGVKRPFVGEQDGVVLF